MSEPMKIDLRRMAKAMDGKSITFVCDPDGQPVNDTKAREVIASYIADGYDKIQMRRDTTPEVKPTKDTSRLARAKAVLARLEQERMDYMRRYHSMIIPAKLRAKIEAAKEEVADCEAYMPQRLSKLLPEGRKRDELINAIIKTHVAADYYTETVGKVKDLLDEAGLTGCNLFTLSDEIERLSQRYADIVCHPEFAGLTDMMVSNAQLLDGIDTLMSQWLKANIPTK